MKRYLFVMLALCAALTFAACGDDHDHDNDGHDHDECGHEHDGDEHGHSHEGDHHELGHVDHEGGWEVHVGHIGELEAGHEGIFEVEVTQGGKATGDAKITIWLADANGDGLTPKSSCEWMADEGVFDGHIDLPDVTPEGTHLMIRVRKGETDFTKKMEVELGHHEEHE